MAQWVGKCAHQLPPLVDALQRCMLEHGILHADETPVRMLKPGKALLYSGQCQADCRP